METFLIRILDHLLNRRKFSDKHAEKLYDLYSDVLRKILPYLKNEKDFSPTLMECRTLLENSSIANPALIKRIDDIIDLKSDTDEEKNHKRTRFEYFAHDIISDCNKLSKILGLGGFTIPQKNLMDAVFSKDYKINCGFILFLIFLIIVVIVFSLK